MSCAKFEAENAAPDASSGAEAGVDAAVDASVDVSVPTDAPPVLDAADGASPLETACAPTERSIVLPPTMQTFASSGNAFTVMPATATTVAVLSDDVPDTASWIARGANSPAELRFAHKTFLAPAGATIKRVAVHARARRVGANTTEGGASVGLYFKLGSDLSSGPMVSSAVTFTGQHHSLVEHPFAARPWVVGDISNLEMELTVEASAASPVQVARMWMEICLAP